MSPIFFFFSLLTIMSGLDQGKKKDTWTGRTSIRPGILIKTVYLTLTFLYLLCTKLKYDSVTLSECNRKRRRTEVVYFSGTTFLP